MANAYGYYGAGSAAQGGIQGAKTLADLIAQQQTQARAAEEVDTRRMAIEQQRQEADAMSQYRMGTLSRQDMANKIAAAEAAAKYGSYGGLAEVTGQPESAFSRYETPPNTLQELLARMLAKGNQQSEPVELGIGHPAGGVQVGMTPDAENVMSVLQRITELQHPLHARTPTPEQSYIQSLVDQERLGTLSEDGAKALKSWRAQVTGQEPKPGTLPKPSTPSALVHDYAERRRRGETLSAHDLAIEKEARAAMGAPAVTAGGVVPQPQKIQKDWRDDANAVYKDVVTQAQSAMMFAKEKGGMGEKSRATIAGGLARLNQLLAQAPTPQDRAAVAQSILDYKKAFMAGPSAPIGQRKLQ